MKKINFPYLAVVLGLTFMPIIILGNTIGEDGLRAVPLLSLLVMNEFALIASAFGVWIGVQQWRVAGFQAAYAGATVLCAVQTILFVLLAVQLWPM